MRPKPAPIRFTRHLTPLPAWPAALKFCLPTPLVTSAVLADTPKQIVITTKFVEITEENAREVGFDWLLGAFNVPGTGRVFGSGGTTGATPGGDPSTDFPFVPPASGSTLVGSRGGPSSPGTLGLAGVFTDSQFQAIIRALEPHEGTDVISTPRVVTRSGQMARIEVVQEIIYQTEFDPPEIPPAGPVFGPQPYEFFNAGEFNFNIFGGAALGNDLSKSFTTRETVETTRTVTRTETRQVQVGVQQQQINVSNDPFVPNYQIINVPQLENRTFTVQEEQTMPEIVEMQELEGIMDRSSPKFGMGFTYFPTLNFGFGGNFEWIHGNFSDAFFGEVRGIFRQPIELPNLGIAPYFFGGLGGISGDAINEFTGSVGAGVQVRPNSQFGIFTEYEHIFLGNGMDFGQIVGGINVVLNDLIGGGGGPPASPATFDIGMSASSSKWNPSSAMMVRPLT